jgi:hypothetical protein
MKKGGEFIIINVIINNNKEKGYFPANKIKLLRRKK